MIFKILGLCLMLLPVAAVLFAVIVLRRNNRDLDFARVKKATEVVKKFWYYVALVTVAYGLLIAGCFFLQSVVNPTLTIRFNYAEASKGQNPNGTRLNPSEIVSDEILEKVIEKGGFKVAVEDLSKTLSLTTALDEEELNTEDPENSLIATDYTMTYSPSFKTLGVNGKKLVQLVAEVYYETYLEKYTENDDILDLTFDDVDAADYCDMGSYLEQKAETLIRFAENYGNENSTFHLGDGETFWAISSKIGNFRDVEIQKFASYVDQYGLSKDAAKLKTVKSYESRLKENDYDLQMANYRVNLEAVGIYDPQMATIVLIPSQNSNMEYYMARTKIGPDDFTNTAMNSLTKATEYQTAIKRYEAVIDAVGSSTASDVQYETADKMYENIKTQLLAFSEECKEICDAYINVKRKGYMQMYTNVGGLVQRIKAVKAAGFTAAALVATVLLFIAVSVSRLAGKRGENK